ncbi:aspartyl beta-hydroxylase [Clostridium bornimense]|uniref:phasin family protein n=1 Tax=Clostridium bornimense TaxID=1216932 RepID=UPI001C1099F9|nr:aspartyl beta-hydroxylase [Clostridium bornimense]MBU5317209.1 aspartyl beta-hydroxylase [Clostridium bornimense]
MNNNMFSDGLKKILLVGIGAMATTTEKCMEIVDELVKKGEVTIEQGKVLNEELKRSIKENENKISDEKITEVLSEIKKMSPEEVEKLKNKLNSI